MTAAIVGAIAPLIQVDGSDLAPATLNALIGLRISSGLRLPSRAVLEFLDDGFKVSADNTFKMGTAIKVKTSTGTVLFTGEVTGVDLDIERGAPNLSVIADDKAYQMTLGNKVRTFTRVSYSDVISQIAGDYGMTVSADSTESVHEYLLQSDSDFGFITEMADRAGYDWWVDADGALQFHPMGSEQGASTDLTFGDNGSLRNFAVRASALHPNRITVNGWNAAQKSPMTFTSERVEATPTANLVQSYLEPSSLQSKSAVTTAYRMFATQSDGTALAKSAAFRSIAGSVVATGECVLAPSVKVGSTVNVSDAGPASGSYMVTEVEHLYDSKGFRTRFTAGDREPTSLVDTLAAPAPSSFRQDGLVIGVVTNLGNSNSPKGYVKVKFPTLGDQIESAWARVVSTGAGDSRGMTFLPEINDEVIIGFESGDVTRPLVIGGLYSGASAALDYGTANGKIAKRQIVSRLGHVIELGDGDQPADQHIWLTLAGGQFFVKLGKDGLTATVPSGKPIAVSAGETKIQIDDRGNIALSGQKISLTAQQDVEISGLNVKLKANMAVEGSGTEAKLSGTAQAELSSGGQTSVKGTAVMIN